MRRLLLLGTLACLMQVIFCAIPVSEIAETRPYDRGHGPAVRGLPKWFLEREVHYVTAKVASLPGPTYEHEVIERVIDGQKIEGHKFVVNDPMKHFSILPPLGGCGHRVKTSDTAAAAGCAAAMNGGFFDMRTGDCLGNLVSNGRVIQNPGVWNAQFGVTNSSEYVAGYISAENVTSMGFQQLIAGVLWLVKDGKSYVDQSRKFESPSSRFVTMAAPRTALAFDSRGRLLVVAIDGDEPTDRGLSLYQFADLLIDLGAVNAVNTDGGGSTTVVINNRVVNHPSDKCPGSDLRCERTVTSIVCMK